MNSPQPCFHQNHVFVKSHVFTKTIFSPDLCCVLSANLERLSVFLMQDFFYLIKNLKKVIIDKFATIKPYNITYYPALQHFWLKLIICYIDRSNILMIFIFLAILAASTVFAKTPVAMVSVGGSNILIMGGLIDGPVHSTYHHPACYSDGKHQAGNSLSID